MTDIWTALLAFFSLDIVYNLFKALVKLAAGYFLARVATLAVIRGLRRYTNAQQIMLARRITFYLILGLFTVSALRELGFQVEVLVGAAGIITLAVGFASQTSVSNLISGLFLMAERAFAVGDIIRVGGTSGEVVSIDLLSVKLRTFDNLQVRIPNESLVKGEITNLSRFPIRRLDIQLGVAYKEEIAKVRKVLLEVADRNPLCLEEPKPQLLFQNFGDSAIELQFSVWVDRTKFIEFKNSICEEIKLAFDAEDIEIPFPHMTLYTGSVTEPFPLQVQDKRPAKRASKSTTKNTKAA